MKKETVVIDVSCDNCSAHAYIQMDTAESLDQKLLSSLWIRLGEEYFCSRCWRSFMRIARTLNMSKYILLIISQLGTNVPSDHPLLAEED